MNATSRHNGRPDADDHPDPTVAMPAARVSGVQAAVGMFDAQLEALRAACSPRELAVVLDLFRRRLDRELEREERALRRWAA